MTPSDSELFVVAGLPKYINTTSSTMSGVAFEVNGVQLNCNLGSLSGYGGCNFADIKVDPKQSAHATYFWQPTRMWWHYKVLFSLEQDGKVILSPERLRVWHIKSYSTDGICTTLLCG